MYEYAVVVYNNIKSHFEYVDGTTYKGAIYNPKDFMKVLNAMAKVGWELDQVAPAYYHTDAMGIFSGTVDRPFHQQTLIVFKRKVVEQESK